MEELKPITRKETFLAKAAGQEVETPTPITREEVFLDAIAKGGGSSLPSVTSSDNGKVLAVKNGAWAADENVLNVTYANSTLSHTYAEIVAAIDAGKTVTLTYSNKKYFAQYYSASNVVFSYQSTISKTIDFCQVANTNAFSVGGYGLVPNPYAAQNGYELIVKNGSWVAQQKKFIVTLTPTAIDYSGTMDKTVAEINEAYEAGMEIWLKVDLGGGAYKTNLMTDVYKSSGYDYPSFGGVLYDDSRNLIIKVGTGVTDDGTHAAYATTVYSLTPAS